MSKEKPLKGKTIVKIMVLVISILVMDFAFNVAYKIMFSLQLNLSSYAMTALGMSFVVLVALPAFSIPDLLEKITKWFLETSIKISSLIFQKNIAAFLIFFVLLFILYIGFYWAWYDKLLFFDSSTQDTLILEKIKKGSEEIRREIFR